MSEDKKCPVDRGKLLIGMECCTADPSPICVCTRNCPYENAGCTETVRKESLAYIYYLEELLGVTV